MPGRMDEFLSVEDLELRDMSDEAIERLYRFWLHQAQQTNQSDQDRYSHGVMLNVIEPVDPQEMTGDDPGRARP